MPSLQLRTSRHSVHTVGITGEGVLYIDVQRFQKSGSSGAHTFYVRAADVTRLKEIAFGGRSGHMSDHALIRLMAASFHSAQYALEWLRWAAIPLIPSLDTGSCHNAEERIPEQAL